MFNKVPSSMATYISQEKLELLGTIIDSIISSSEKQQTKEFTMLEVKEFIYCEVKLYDAYDTGNGNDVYFYQNEIPSKFMGYHKEIETKLRKKAPEQYKAVMTALNL
jgi:hypothetical protein